jgi:hypothetical protein
MPLWIAAPSARNDVCQLVKMELAPLQSQRLAALEGISHGFFTRRGGVSEGIYQSLNCGHGSGDRQENIYENCRRVSKYLGAMQLVGLRQIHSSRVITISHFTDVMQRPEADALVTNQPEIALSVLTADCAPVLFADAQAGVIGAAHAGWKGALHGVLEQTVHSMQALGAKRENLIAAIGPCIAQDSYQVDGGFYRRFCQQKAEYGTFFDRDLRASGHYRFNLGGFVAHRLQQAGVGQVRRQYEDTYNQPKFFFSFRRTTHNGEKDYGRQISAIMLRA